MELQKLNAAHLTGLYTHLLRNGRGEGIGLSPTTVRDIHRRLRKALGDAVRWGLVERNAAELADPPPAKTVQSARRRAMRTWSEEQLRSFLDVIDGHRFAAVWHVAAFTGLRRSELLGLRWADVELAAGRLTVRHTVVEGEEGWVADDEQKTTGSARTIHLDSATVGMLRTHRERQRFARRAAGHGWQDHDLVFCDEFGAWLSPAAVTQAFRRAVEAAGVPRIRLHDVRHTHATLLLRAGVNPKVVSERHGHSSVAFTLDTYAHVIPGMHPDAAELFAMRVLGDVRDPSASQAGEDGADV